MLVYLESERNLGFTILFTHKKASKKSNLQIVAITRKQFTGIVTIVIIWYISKREN